MASSMPAERLPLIWSSDTFTTDVSMISISVGSMTVRAMSHLFIFPLLTGQVRRSYCYPSRHGGIGHSKSSPR